MYVLNTTTYRYINYNLIKTKCIGSNKTNYSKLIKELLIKSIITIDFLIKK